MSVGASGEERSATRLWTGRSSMTGYRLTPPFTAESDSRRRQANFGGFPEADGRSIITSIAPPRDLVMMAAAHHASAEMLCPHSSQSRSDKDPSEQAGDHSFSIDVASW